MKKAQMSKTVIGLILLLIAILIGFIIIHFVGKNSFSIMKFIFGK